MLYCFLNRHAKVEVPITRKLCRVQRHSYGDLNIGHFFFRNIPNTWQVSERIDEISFNVCIRTAQKIINRILSLYNMNIK